MVIVAGINGLLGGQGVATLCIHGVNYLHFTLESHDEEHNACEGHSCGGSEHDHSESSAVADSEPCEGPCTDIELKGVENEAPQRNAFDGFPSPSFTGLELSHYYSDTFSGATNTPKILPPPRGPPPLDTVTELCIKKTVLRL